MKLIRGIFPRKLRILILLQCVLTLLWANSYFYDEFYPPLLASRGCFIQSYEGRVMIFYFSPNYVMHNDFAQKPYVVIDGQPEDRQVTSAMNRALAMHGRMLDCMEMELHPAGVSNLFGFEHSQTGMYSLFTDYPASSLTFDLYAIPWWFLWLLSGIPLASICRRHFREQRNLRMRGHCRNCGYDLRATPQRCPECGMVPQESSQT